MNPWNTVELANKADLLDHVARVGRALAHGSRLALLEYVAQTERSVGELAELASLKLTTTSAHLQILRDAGLIVGRRSGSTVLYELASPDVARLVSDLYDCIEPRDAGDRGREGEVLLDVRPAKEFAQGHLPGAVNVPLEELRERIDELPEGPRYVAYCRGRFCGLSHEAAALLRDRGRAVRVAEVGALEWLASGELSAT